MMGINKTDFQPPARSALCPTTHWSVVLTAGDSTAPGAPAALQALCAAYWYPLYAFVRRRGYEVADAEDLTQEFFARLLEKHYLSGIDRSKGRFRSFLLAALDHFLAKEWRREHAQKRGGGITFIPFDDDGHEQQYQQVAAALSPERIFDQQWAMTLLDQVVGRLREEFFSAGKGSLFEDLKIFLTGEKRAGGYAELAAKLQTTEAALKMAVSRMRQRYGELLRTEVANTVGNPEEVEEELRALFAALE